MFNNLKYLFVFRRNSNEINQSFIRLGLVTAICVYSITHDYLNHDLVISRNYPLLVSFFFIAILECFWAFKCSNGPDINRHKIYFRVITNVIDNILLAVVIIYMEESGAPLFVIYLWITFGIGIRYGGRYLILSAILNIASFLTVITIDPIWTDGDTIYISVGILLSLVILPAYVYILILKLTVALESEKAANLIKKSFLANINHELRTPLNSILNLTELIRTYKLPEKVFNMLDMVQTSAKTQLQIVNGILDISKIESGLYELINNRFNLYDLVYEVGQIILPLADKKGLRYITYIESSCKCNYVGASDQIKQILINLLGNAVKFTDMGFVKITVQSGALSSVSHEIIFRIEDSGIGISKQNQNDIFKPFTQADFSITRKYGGTGLGVTISNELSKLMGGTLLLESNLGTGSIFTFRLKLGLTEPDELILQDSLKIYPLNLGDEYSEVISYYSNYGLNVILPENIDELEYKGHCIENNAVSIIDYNRPFTDKYNTILQSRDIITISANHLPDSNDHYVSPITSIKTDSSHEELLNAINICLRYIPKNFNKITVLPKVNRPLNILIGEDNSTLREIYRLIFKGAGHNVCITKNGQEALDSAIKHKYELIILDLHMPEISGIDVAEQIKKIIPGDAYKIVLLTADNNNGVHANEFNNIFSLVLTKPIEALDLLHKVHRLFDVESIASYESDNLLKIKQSDINKEMEGDLVKNNVQIIGEGAFRNLLIIYDNEVNEKLIKLTSAILAEDYPEQRNISHTLHGAALSIGANEMGKKLNSLLRDVSERRQFDVNELLIVGVLAKLHKIFMCNCLEYLNNQDMNKMKVW